MADLVREVRDVIRHLEAEGAPVPGVHGGVGRAADEPLRGAVARCNASLEQCLEDRRGFRDVEATAGAAKDELRRLAGLLTEVHPADAAMVMRRIRRILGRFDRADPAM